MPKFTLEITCDGAAFHDSRGSFSPDPELVYILMRFARGIDSGSGLTRKVFDSNGNTVGYARMVIGKPAKEDVAE